jgi:hypothetical protein
LENPVILIRQIRKELTRKSIDYHFPFWPTEIEFGWSKPPDFPHPIPKNHFLYVHPIIVV